MTAPSTDALPESFIPANAVSTITGIQKEAAEKCIKNHVPFVLYAERPEEEYTFYADHPCNHDSDADEFGVLTKEGMKQMRAEEGKRKFYVGFFDQQESPVIIKEKLNAEEVLTTDFKTPSVLRNPVIRQKCSTIQMVFQSQVFAIKSRLKADHVSGKVVLSKVVSTASERPIFEVVEEYFKSTPSVLRAVYYHPLLVYGWLRPLKYSLNTTSRLMTLLPWHSPEHAPLRLTGHGTQRISRSISTLYATYLTY